jgi:uncharacterized protein
MSRWDRLLAVQDQDTHADQLRHRSATLPVRDVLAKLEAEAVALDARVAETGERLTVLKRSQTRLEDEVALLEEKVARTDRQLYSGETNSPKELQALQDEIASLRTRITELEDDQLEVMEAREPVEADLGTLTTERHELGAQIDERQQELAAVEAEISAELATVEQRRAELATDLPDDVLASYEKLRGALGGIAIARLVNGTCQGCHLQLSAVEVDRIRKLPADETVTCEECGRFLVR